MDSLLSFHVAPGELIVRGSAMYWFIFLLFRLLLRRDVGSIAIADVLLLVLIADAAQNAMAGGYSTLAEGAVLVATIAAWNYMLDLACFRIPLVRRLLQPAPIELVRDGRVNRRNMRKEMVTWDELQAKLHEYGLEDVGRVKVVRMESDGEITVIARDGAAKSSPRRSLPGAGG